jgi:acyl-coenzyme A thioesterase PaaI-like protein
MPAHASLVTVEYKINVLAPGRGERLIARGTVIRPGRTLSIARGEVYAESEGRSILCAAMQQTLMMLSDTPDTPE